MLRKAFTMIELVFIITILGILSALMVPRMQDTNLQEATDQLMKHMRLAQSLALSQDFYLSESSQSNEYSDAAQKVKSSTYWFKRWWQIQFHGENTGDSSYSIYSDHPTTTAIPNSLYDAQPNYSNVITNSDLFAVDAQSGQLIAKDNLGIPNGSRFVDVDIEAKYNVSIDMEDCQHIGGPATTRHILFDHLGRPHCGKGNADNSLNPFDHIMNNTVRITLSHNGTNENRVICVEPESGFIHVCG